LRRYSITYDVAAAANNNTDLKLTTWCECVTNTQSKNKELILALTCFRFIKHMRQFDAD
jgi:hypothetical protein